MLQSFTKKYTDLSTEDEFAFIFYCDLCDKAWKSVPLKEQTGKECFTLIAALFVTGGFVIMIFLKKKTDVPAAVREMAPLNDE